MRFNIANGSASLYDSGSANGDGDYTSLSLGFNGMPFIKGRNAWRYAGPRPDMYQIEHNELFASIRSGKPINDGVRLAHSTLAAIMGRMAAYTGQEVTWDMALNSRERLVPENITWDMAISVPPIANPGETQFV